MPSVPGSHTRSQYKLVATSTQVGLVATQAFMNYADGVLTCSADDSNPFNVRPSPAGVRNRPSQDC